LTFSALFCRKKEEVGKLPRIIRMDDRPIILTDDIESAIERVRRRRKERKKAKKIKRAKKRYSRKFKK
jgi:hypothetical protein